jgi:ribosomal protein L35
MKTNKAYYSRLKVTRSGKLKARAKGQNHFNAKESRRSQLAKKRSGNFHLTNKMKSRFLA